MIFQLTKIQYILISYMFDLSDIIISLFTLIGVILSIYVQNIIFKKTSTLETINNLINIYKQQVNNLSLILPDTSKRDKKIVGWEVFRTLMYEQDVTFNYDEDIERNYLNIRSAGIEGTLSTLLIIIKHLEESSLENSQKELYYDTLRTMLTTEEKYIYNILHVKHPQSTYKLLKNNKSLNEKFLSIIKHEF